MSSRANFRCTQTGKELVISVYRTKFIGSEQVYTDRQGKPLVNPDNGAPLEFIPIEGGFTTSLGSSKAVGKTKMLKHLKQRSHDHYKKDVAHVKQQIIKNSTPTN